MGVTTAVPTSPDELVSWYRDYVVGLVQRCGIPAQDAEDVANDILLRELEVNILGMYNPEHESEHQGIKRKVTFKAFLSARVALRCRGKRDAINRRTAREPLLCDSSAEDGARWIDIFGGADWDDYSALTEQEFLGRMRAHLARVPRRSEQDSCDLVALFDELVREVREEGEVTTASVRERFSVSDTTACAWIARLRQIMLGAGEDLPVPERHVISGVVLELADIRSAIDILRADKTIMVKQPLARAGHPLAKAKDPTWYHPFSKDERKLFPHLEVDPQTHKKPAGHVKLAVIHRLERMLGVAMAEAPDTSGLPAPPGTDNPGQCAGTAGISEPTVPEEPDIPELIESRLWQQGVAPQVVDEILAMVEQYRQEVSAS